jgi:hypothetical protein
LERISSAQNAGDLFSSQKHTFLRIKSPLCGQNHAVLHIGHPQAPGFICFDIPKSTYLPPAAVELYSGVFAGQQ